MEGEDRCRLRIAGRVQGVGFRAWTAWRARELGLRGWVRNLSDGSVELEAAGDPVAVSRLREDVARGPSHAAVTDVTSLAPSSDALPRGFEVRY